MDYEAMQIDELEASVNRIRNQRVQVEEMKRRLKQSHQLLQQRESLLRKLQKQLLRFKQAAEKAGQYKAMLVVEKEACMSMKEERDRMKVQMREQESLIASLKKAGLSKERDTEEERMNREEMTETLRNALVSVQKENGELKRQLEEEKMSSRQQVEKYEQKLRETRKEQTSLQERNVLQDAAIKSLGIEVKALAQRVAEREGVLEKLQESNDHHRREAKRRKLEVSGLKADKLALQVALKESEVLNKKYTERISNAVSHIDAVRIEARQKVMAMKNEVIEAKAEVEMVKKEKEEMDKRCKERLVEMEKEVEKKITEMVGMRKTHEVYRETIADQKLKLENLALESTDAQHKMQELVNKLLHLEATQRKKAKNNAQQMRKQKLLISQFVKEESALKRALGDLTAGSAMYRHPLGDISSNSASFFTKPAVLGGDTTFRDDFSDGFEPSSFTAAAEGGAEEEAVAGEERSNVDDQEVLDIDELAAWLAENEKELEGFS